MPTPHVTAEAPVSPFTATGAGERQRVLAGLAAQGPVQRIVMPGGEPAWLVTAYDTVRQALADPRLVKGGPPAQVGPPLADDTVRAMASDLLHLDPPDHTRLRRLVTAAFTRRRVEALAPRITRIADELLARLPAGSPFDLIEAYAFPLPMAVIAELLGVPGGDMAQFRQWSATIVAGSVAGADAWSAAVTELVGYVRELLALKRRAPADDLLSALVAVREESDRLSEDELTSMVFLLLLAGHETTVNLIANAVLTLLGHPAELAALRGDPGRVADVVEEVLRFEGPVQITTPRYAAEPLVLAGTAIAAGDMVVTSLLAANRDAARFADPTAFDPGRGHDAHLAFGHGIHHCLGAPLARLEGRVALTRLLARHPDLRLAEPADRLAWRPGFLMHGLTRLPLAVC